MENQTSKELAAAPSLDTFDTSKFESITSVIPTLRTSTDYADYTDSELSG